MIFCAIVSQIGLFNNFLSTLEHCWSYEHALTAKNLIPILPFGSILRVIYSHVVLPIMSNGVSYIFKHEWGTIPPTDAFQGRFVTSKNGENIDFFMSQKNKFPDFGIHFGLQSDMFICTLLHPLVS